MAVNEKMQDVKENMKAQVCEEIRGVVNTRGYIYAKIFLKHGKARKSRRGTGNVAIATSPRICYL